MSHTKFSWMSDEELLTSVEEDSGANDKEIELAARLLEALELLSQSEVALTAQHALTIMEDRP